MSACRRCLLDFPDSRLTPNRVRCADLNPTSNLTNMYNCQYLSNTKITFWFWQDFIFFFQKEFISILNVLTVHWSPNTRNTTQWHCHWYLGFSTQHRRFTISTDLGRCFVDLYFWRGCIKVERKRNASNLVHNRSQRSSFTWPRVAVVR